MYKTYRKNHRTQKPATQQDYLLVIEATAFESKRIYKIRASKEQLVNELNNSNHPRLFDPKMDDRGPEVKMLLTYTKTGKPEESTWFPETEGSYLIALTPDRPESLKCYRLHMGDVSTPQSTKAAIHRVYLDIISKTPELRPYLKCVKRPCVFCKDHPDAPGGSSVDVDIATLPPPCEPNKVARFYM